MTVVTGVLLDHVDQELAQRDRLTGTVVSDEVEVGVARELLGEGDLIPPRGPRLIHDILIGHGDVEVAVGIGLSLIALGNVLAHEPPTEPPAFHLGHVSHQTKQRNGRGLDRAMRELSRVKALTLQLQREALTAQELEERRPLITQ